MTNRRAIPAPAYGHELTIAEDEHEARSGAPESSSLRAQRISGRCGSIEEIARLVGHASTRTTEIVYRRELPPVITTGAEIMDELFSGT
jgi:hypothetical protein